ncbi:hypothetical protein [Nonomuraea zeae]|nr:hypothetical protein [Nonomuraea zeae]
MKFIVLPDGPVSAEPPFRLDRKIVYAMDGLAPEPVPATMGRREEG